MPFELSVMDWIGFRKLDLRPSLR